MGERIRIQPRNTKQEGTYQMPFLFFNAELLLYGTMATVPVVVIVAAEPRVKRIVRGLAVVIAPHRKIFC